jgi:hypothetical protein
LHLVVNCDLYISLAHGRKFNALGRLGKRIEASLLSSGGQRDPSASLQYAPLSRGEGLSSSTRTVAGPGVRLRRPPKAQAVRAADVFAKRTQLMLRAYATLVPCRYSRASLTSGHR